MEINIVKFIQNLSNKFLDAFFWIITKLGEETVFFFVLALIYICYSKKFAIKFSFYYLISVAFNNIIKLIVRRPRPHIASTEISNRLSAEGYSFPSGHTQGYFAIATTGFVEISNKSNKRCLKITYLTLFLIIGIFVMLSRLYWGQHYLSDVVVGMMFGISVIYFLEWFLRILPGKIKLIFTTEKLYLIIGCISLLLFIIMLILELTIGLYSRTIYRFSAVFVSLMIGYFVDKKYIGYTENQGFKLGFVKYFITIGVLVGLYLLCNLIIPMISYQFFIVYLFLGLICTILLPLIFKFVFKRKDNHE